MLFQYPSYYQIDSIYTGYIDTFLWPQQYCHNESQLYLLTDIYKL